MDIISAFRVFVCVAETGGFTAAEREFGVDPPAVSKQMAALEQHLGTRQFNRSAHAFALTYDGLALVDNARLAISTVEEAQDLARLRRQQTKGALRIAGPVVFGRTRLVPALRHAEAQHRQVGRLQAMANPTVRSGVVRLRASPPHLRPQVCPRC